MKFKKAALALVLLGAVFCAAAFAGCSGGQKLRVINYRPEDQKFYDWVVKEFEKENAGVRVVYEAVDTSGYSNLLNSRIKAKAVDVFGAEAAYVGSVQMQPEMLPLNDLTGPDGAPLWDSIDDSAKFETKLGENYLVAPLNKVTMLVYYNKDILNEENLGLTYINGEYPTTWKEFENTVYRLKAKKNGGEIKDIFAYGGLESWPMSMIVSMAEVACVRSEEPDFYLHMALQEAGYDFGNPLYRDFFEKLKFICNNMDSSSTGMPYSRTPARFALGGYAMMLDGSWSYNQVKTANPDANIGFFPLPANDSADKNGSVPYKTAAGFAIANSSSQKELAKKFVEFQYRPEVYQKYIDYVCSAPTVKGVTLSDSMAAEMFAFDFVLTAENMWIPGIEGTNYFRDIGANFITSSYTVQNAVEKMNSSYEGNRDNWTKESSLGPWFERFYPDAQR